jgi:hypothetical protein
MESCLSITNGDKFKGPYLFMGIFSSMPFSFPSLLIPKIILILGFLGAYVLKHLASKRSLPKGTFATITHMTKTLIPKKSENFYYETSL